MYYPFGLPTLLRLPQENVQEIEQVVCNRDKILTAILTSDSILIWYVKPCVPIISHRRSTSSVEQLGKNVLVQWKPDSSMLVVVTEHGHLIIYHLALPVDVKTLYDLQDPPAPSLKRERDELYVKEIIPPLFFSLAFEVEVEGGISDLVAIREELMIATKSGRILRFSWEGQEIRDYSLDLRRIPFCVDQQVLKAVPVADRSVFVSKIAYSPLIGGYAVVLNDGRAALLVASTPSFDPNSVTGIWALQLEDANSVALNHKYKLIAFGRNNSEGIVYSVDELTGGLVISHRLVLPARDYPGCPGPVSCLRWTPDGTGLALAWQRGGFSIWSTFGAMIMCSLCWDYGPNVSDPVGQNPLCIKSLDWSAEGYQMWIVNAKTRSKKNVDPEFMPFPEQFNNGSSQNSEATDATTMPLANRAMVLQFVKSPASVNPSMTKQEKIYLQGEDTIFLNQSNGGGHKGWVRGPQMSDFISNESNEENRFLMACSGSKLWMTIAIPHSYISTSWPIRYTAMDDTSEYLAVAGRTGFAHYSVSTRKWRLFGNETQEKDFIVTGGILWWKENVIMGCYNLAASQDEIRLYPRKEKLDNAFAKILKVDAQVLLVNISQADQLIVFCADSVVTIYNLTTSHNAAKGTSGVVEMTKQRTYDVSMIPGLNFHPASVVLIALSNLKIETSRSGNRESFPRESSPSGTSSYKDPNECNSLILNICGRVVMIQTENKRDGRESPQLTLPTVLASGCEMIWFPKTANIDKPHLTWSLWLYCGAHGMRVWLPVFPREGDHGLNFMSKRIMLHFPIEKFYPLAILFEDAVILGAESDTVLYSAKSISTTLLPFSTLERTSLLFLHPILRQLIRRNLGYHAWEIARTCMNLPYFQHSLELLLHEVLEEEATSTEPIPDALLPSIVDFIQEFPVYHQTVGRCARKTEVALWPHLFSAVGSPKALFLESLHSNDLETAASYLLILQNLELPSIAQSHATLLLDAALDRCSWDLARELVRFLRTIDPADVEEASQRPLVMTPQSPPMNASAQEEEISLLLGTLQVPRGRVPSSAAKQSPKDHEKLGRSNSESKTTHHYRSRKASCSSQKDSSSGQSAEEFFIDVILQRHARKLLAAFRLHDLGTFAAQLDFHIVSWLKKESGRAARLDNAVQSLRRLHADFQWPYPILINSVLAQFGTTSLNDVSSKMASSVGVQETPVERKTSSNSSGVSSSVNPHPNYSRSSSAQTLLADKMKVLKVDHPHHISTRISDSGYISHATEDPVHSSEASLSEQTINAMLKPHGFREDLSILSEDVASVISPDDRNESPTSSSDWTSLNHTEVCQEFISKGPPKAEVQLRYLLQIMMEASCLEIASVISVLLKDALALIRIVNAARSSQDDKNCVSRLFNNLKAVEAWAQSECHGYAPFFQAIQPQLNSLKMFLVQSENGSNLATPHKNTALQLRKLSPGNDEKSTHSKIFNRSLSSPNPMTSRSFSSTSIGNAKASCSDNTKKDSIVSNKGGVDNCDGFDSAEDILCSSRAAAIDSEVAEIQNEGCIVS